MKTKAQVLRENPQYKTLINAVINRIGLESVQDVNNHGIDGGFNGFIYTVDTCAFYARHRKAIIELAKDMAESFGTNVCAMVAEFGCLNGDYSWQDAADTIYGEPKYRDDQISNALAWFAAEEVCRMFEE